MPLSARCRDCGGPRGDTAGIRCAACWQRAERGAAHIDHLPHPGFVAEAWCGYGRLETVPVLGMARRRCERCARCEAAAKREAKRQKEIEARWKAKHAVPVRR